MIKKNFLILVLLLSLLLISCSTAGNSINTEENTDKLKEAEREILESEKVAGGSNDLDDGENDTDASKVPLDELEQNKIVFLSALDKHIASDTVSETLLKAYGDADNVMPIPIFGTYLEETDVVLYAFFKDEVVCSTAMLSFNIKNNPVDIELVEFAQTDTSKYPYVFAHSNEACYLEVKECLTVMPDFELLGIVLNDAGYPSAIPVGRCKGETVIKYFFNEPLNFNLVEPFETIEEGRIAFAKYLAERDTIKMQLPVFPWKNARFFEGGVWMEYSLDDMFDDSNVGNKNKIMPMQSDVDSWIALPLLDENLQEGIFISHLLYCKNKLIGEVITVRGANEQLFGAYIEVAEKANDGTYIPIEKSEYQKAIETARSLFPHIEIKGVIFKNGEYIPFGYQGEEVVYLVQ